MRRLATIKYTKPVCEGTAKGTKIQLAKNNKAVITVEYIRKIKTLLNIFFSICLVNKKRLAEKNAEPKAKKIYDSTISPNPSSTPSYLLGSQGDS